jgi:hypothetical protein
MRVIIALFVLGCGTSGGAANAVPDAAATAAPCAEPPGGINAPTAVCIKEVRGTVTSLDGAPLANVPVSVCGLACFAATTDKGGGYTIPVNAKLPLEGYIVSAYGRPTHAGIYVRLPATPGDSVAMPPIALAPLTDEGTYLPEDGAAAATVKAGPLRLQVETGTTWELDLEDTVAAKEGRRLRYARVAMDKAPAFAANAKEVFALAPFKAKSDKPVRITIETQAFAPDTVVEFVSMGDDISVVDNTGGLAKVVAKGRISADGMRAEMDPNEGLTTLTWLALRARP